MDLIESKQGELDFDFVDVHIVTAEHKCDGPQKGDCLKMCGQLVTASLFNEENLRLLKGSFMSQVVLDA